MKTTLINEICNLMSAHLTEDQNRILNVTLQKVFRQFNIPDSGENLSDQAQETNMKLLNSFIAAKKIEGCSENTLKYYSSTLLNMINSIQKNVCDIHTDDIRFYLCRYQEMRNSSKATLDNIRRIMSSFFIWLEDEDYIVKSPVRRIHKVKATQVVRETLSDENLESLRDQCGNSRDLAIVDILISTGIRVGELVNLNRSDIDFASRECIVLGKGDKERRVYFDAKTKIHLQQYLAGRNDDNNALFVSLNSPWKRLSIAGVERFQNWETDHMYTTFIRINSAEPWLPWLLRKECRLSSFRNCLAIPRSIQRFTIMESKYLWKAMSLSLHS